MLRQVLCRRAPAFFKPVLKRFEIIADFSGEVSIRTSYAGLLVAAASCRSSCLVLLLAREAVESQTKSLSIPAGAKSDAPAGGVWEGSENGPRPEASAKQAV